MAHIFKKVDRIVFSLLSPEDVEKVSSAKIVTAELYDKEGYPVDGGLMDIRLGVIDPGLRCKTCGCKIKECMGHFGHIELARPIIHVFYANLIYDMLRGTCNECNKILLSEEEAQKYYGVILQAEKDKNIDYRRKISKFIIAKIKQVKKCPSCNSKRGALKIEKPTTFYLDDKRITPVEIRARLEKISDRDCELIGANPRFARPEWAVLTVLPIPPVTMRPSITLETGERSEDDLTHKLGDVVRINQRLFENINAGAPEIIIEDLWDLLQYHVTTYFDNSIPQIPPARHRSGQTLRTLTERIKSKEGRFRHNLAGKRVNYAARTVISPDPMIDFNEVGIPKSVAMELTVPERVNSWNIEWLKELVKNGPKNYPGANYVIWPNDKKKKITDDTKEQVLNELGEGFIVERHLIDGDVSIFNRQPSLHRMSIMCHKIKVLPGRSFRLNPSVCVSPNTLVQLTSGTQRKIDDLKNCWKESEVATFDFAGENHFGTFIKKFWGLKPESYGVRCYKIETKEGRDVTVTEDHPFYTSQGIRKARNIKVGDKVIIRPIETPLYEELDKVLITEKELIRHLFKKEKKTYVSHTLKTLKELKLIPLNLKDQRCMILARLLGHLFGDGTFILKEHEARMIFRGSKKDLEGMQNDLRNLGFNPEKIYIKTSDGVIQTIKGKVLNVRGKGLSFEVRSKPLAVLFAILGAPNGDKVETRFGIPKWIMKSPKYIKREFLASYFGSELTTPKIRQSSKTNFRNLVFKISKTSDIINSGIFFINEIKKLLVEFGVDISYISKEPGNIRKDGKKTVSLAANISKNKSKLNFFGKIGYVYNKRRDDIARLCYAYSLFKEKELEKRMHKYKLAHELRNKGCRFKDIAKKLNVSVGSLENWIYDYKSSSLPINFLSFDEWTRKYAVGAGGLIYETVAGIKEDYCPFVYDITTEADTHNFFANGFLTKNCNPYNADFDGDEMNLHIPQSEEARTEAEILMQVQTQIMDPKSGSNVIGCVEDSVTGNYLLSKDMILSKEDAIDLLYSIGVDNVKFEKEKVNGKEVISALFQKDFNFIGSARQKKLTSKEDRLIIRNGKIVSGIIDASSIGEENGELIREFYRKYAQEETLKLMGNLFRLGIKVLLKKGFTTSISDSDINLEILVRVRELIDDAYKDVYKLVEEYEKSELEALPGKTVKETLEVKSLEILNKVRNKTGNLVVENVSFDVPTIVMARCGAKGNVLNFAQMSSCVGQQALGGQRINRGYRYRTLPIFKRGDLGPDAHGFIKNSFKKGLNPHEFFFHAMTGRDSLMDTALRTPKSGYLYRRLANALQDIKVEYDNTVRNASRVILQFKYGEDGIDVSKSEGGTISAIKAVEDVIELKE